MVTEIYKDIRGYEGLYQVSNLGNVKSLQRTITNSRGQVRGLNVYLLKPNKKRTGYLEVSLRKDGKQRSFLIHRLVASNFISNNEGKPQVNHINGIKTDNRVENLEWCTVSENTKHAYKNNLSNFKNTADKALFDINEKTSYKKLIFIKKNIILEFSSTSEASKMLKLDRDNITRAIRKNQKVGGWQVFGYKIANEECLAEKSEG